VNFHSRFDLQRSEWGAETISALEALHFPALAELPDSLAALLVKDIANVLAHLLRELLILLDLLFSVPEPLVNLLLF